MRVALLVLLLVAGCERSSTLVVQVRTDLVPMRDFASIRVRAWPLAEPAMSSEGSRAAADSRAWGAGVRVAEFADLGVGDHRLEVEALDASGALVLGRPVRIQLDGGVTVVTILLTRDCSGVVCSDPAANACLGGRCVAERCLEEETAECGSPECESSTDCAAGSACTNAECTPSGSCFEAPNHDACMAGELCDPVDGCTAETPPPGAAELCNLRDDDMDGVTDEASLVHVVPGGIDGALANVGADIGLAYWRPGDAEIHIGTFRDDGPITHELVGDAGAMSAGEPDITADAAGGGFAVTWSFADGVVSEIHSDLVSLAGVARMAPVRISGLSRIHAPSIAAHPSGFGVGYARIATTGVDEVSYTSYDAMLDAPTGPVVVSAWDGFNSSETALISSAGYMYLFWPNVVSSRTEGIVTRFNGDGSMPSEIVTGAFGENRALAGEAGTEVFVYGSDTMLTAFAFEMGTAQYDVPLTTGSMLSDVGVALTSGGAAFMWLERGGPAPGVYLRELDPAGTMTREVVLRDIERPSGSPLGAGVKPTDILWTGTELLIAASDQDLVETYVLRVCP